MSIHSREIVIVVVIALLAFAGSQLPRLIRMFGDHRSSPASPEASGSEPRDDDGPT